MNFYYGYATAVCPSSQQQRALLSNSSCSGKGNNLEINSTLPRKRRSLSRHRAGSWVAHVSVSLTSSGFAEAMIAVTQTFCYCRTTPLPGGGVLLLGHRSWELAGFTSSVTQRLADGLEKGIARAETGSVGAVSCRRMYVDEGCGLMAGCTFP